MEITGDTTTTCTIYACTDCHAPAGKPCQITCTADMAMPAGPLRDIIVAEDTRCGVCLFVLVAGSDATQDADSTLCTLCGGAELDRREAGLPEVTPEERAWLDAAKEQAALETLIEYGS